MVREHIRGMTCSDELIFHPVTYEGFEGGYYLHPLLPYSPADICYFDKTNDILVLISGSVYNQPELLLLGNNSVPVPDPELIARLFLMEGPGFVEKLNGDFAIFVLQPSKREAYLFRDHVGIRPLAWTTDMQSLYFSTDITGLCRVLSDSRVIENDYLLGYFKYIDFRKTPDKKVKKLHPGHFLHFSDKGTEIFKYWHPEKIRIDRKLSYDRMLSDLKSILWNSVQIRCSNRFNAGAHVSSGIDSGIISALARKEYSHQKRFYGFSWSPRNFTPGDIKYDERELVLKSCDKSGILPVFSELSQVDFNHIISSFDDNYGLYFEYKTIEQASAVNTNLIFSGWGGDEFISTGDRGIEQDLLSGLNLHTFFRRNPVRTLRKFIKNQLYFVLYPALGILDKGTAQSFRDDARYILKPFRKSDRNAIKNFFSHTSRRQLHLRMLEFYHLQNRCESWMTGGYRKGVEYRYPLLDKRIIEYMLKVPSILLCKTDLFRPLLRLMGEGILPEEVRMNLSKTDPVSLASTMELFKASAQSLMLEVDEWKTNQNMDFVDFELLNQDIRNYKESSVDSEVLFKTIVYLKAIHEFTKRYNEK